MMPFELNDFGSGYVRRVVDAELDELFSSVPAVLLDGAKGVGKTETALQRSGSVRRLDQAIDREIVAANLDGIGSAATPLLLDEWQRLPEVWDTVRRHVDINPAGGRFVLTGSTPGSVPDIETHSGAGRIATIRMRPLTIVERLDVDPAISMRALIQGTAGNIVAASPLGLRDYTDEIVRGGFPGMRHLSGRALRNRLDGYLELVVVRELAEAGLRVRRPEVLMGWLRAYAAATATTTTWEKVRAAANPGHRPPAASTTAPYIELLRRFAFSIRCRRGFRRGITFGVSPVRQSTISRIRPWQSVSCTARPSGSSLEARRAGQSSAMDRCSARSSNRSPHFRSACSHKRPRRRRFISAPRVVATRLISSSNPTTVS